MQKITDILEQYVEWIALAIGGLFLLLMVAIYLVGTPVKAKIGERTVNPGNVEVQVYDQAGRELEQAMRDPRMPEAKVQPYAQAFVDHMQMQQGGVKLAAAGVFVPGGSPTQPLKTIESTTEQKPVTAVAGLPEVPAPKWFGSSSGKSNVKTEPGATATYMDMGGYGPPEGYGPPQGMYGPPPGVAFGPPPEYGGPQPEAQPRTTRTRRGVPAAGDAQPAGPGGEDKVWVSQAFTVSADEMTEAFEKAKLPDNAGTIFLRLDVQRQEQMPDGSWGNDTSIDPLDVHQVPDYPKAGASSEERIYADWAARNQQTILAPNFYPQVAGDRWWAPGQENPNEIKEVRPVILPQPGIRGRRNQMNPYGPPPEMMGPPQQQQRGRRNYQVRDGQRPPTGAPGGMPPEAYAAMMAAQEQAARMGQQQAANMGGMGQGMPGMTGMPGMPGAVSQDIPEGFTVPTGSFIPAELEGDIFIWVHDDTVTPGKTYRYRMAYRLRNPVYGNPQAAAEPDAAKQLAITSAFSDWGTPVRVSDTIRFFVATGPAAGASSVKFDVYKWQEGEWHLKQFTTPVGDIIGEKDGRIDYTTGWSLADVNAGSAVLKEPVILADASGQLDMRSFGADQGQASTFKRESGYRDPNAPAPVTPGMPPGFDPSMMGPPPEMMGPMGPMGPTGPTGRTRRAR